MTHPLASLRKSLACAHPAATSEMIALGAESLDRRLGGGILRAALHEAYAGTAADAPAATGFALALARRAMASAEKPLLWARQEATTAESGAPYPPGLADIGVDPAAVAFIRVRDAKEALQAGAEAGRCATVGATLIELFGEARAYDLTASRRLTLAAAATELREHLERAAQQDVDLLVVVERGAMSDQPTDIFSRGRVGNDANQRCAAHDATMSFGLVIDTCRVPRNPVVTGTTGMSTCASFRYADRRGQPLRRPRWQRCQPA